MFIEMINKMLYYHIIYVKCQRIMERANFRRIQVVFLLEVKKTLKNNGSILLSTLHAQICF